MKADDKPEFARLLTAAAALDGLTKLEAAA